MQDEQWPDLSGEWILEITYAGIARLPVVGEFKTSTYSRQRVRIEQDGNEIELVGTTESLEIESSSSLVRTIIPPAFLHNLPEIRRTGRIHAVGDRFELRFPRHWNVVGASLNNPGRDPLPSNPHDPRVVDHENDGHPGATIRVEGMVNGSIRIVQRRWDEWTIPLNDNHQLLPGTVRWEEEQVILSATSRFLRRQPDTRPDPQNNKIKFHRPQSAHRAAPLHRQAS